MKLLRYVQCGLPHDLSDLERRERRRIRQDAQTAELISLCSAIDSLHMRVASDFDYGECWSLVCCLALEEQLNHLKTVRILGDGPSQSYVQHPRPTSVLGPQHRSHLTNLGTLFNFPSIENLQIGGPERCDQLSKYLFNAVMFDSPNYSNVTSLALCQIELGRHCFANDILPTCSSLKHLTYYFDARLLSASDGDRLAHRYNELSRALARCNPDLATLVWEAFDRNEDEEIFDGCRDMTSLIDITLPWWALAKERGRNVLGRNLPSGRRLDADNSPSWRTVHVPSILPACLQTLRLVDVPFHGYIKAKTRQLYVSVICALAQHPRMSELREIRLENWYRSRPSLDYPEHNDHPQPLERDMAELARKGWKVSEVAGARGGALDVLLERESVA